jgi:hypothetical protein
LVAIVVEKPSSEQMAEGDLFLFSHKKTNFFQNIFFLLVEITLIPLCVFVQTYKSVKNTLL